MSGIGKVNRLVRLCLWKSWNVINRRCLMMTRLTFLDQPDPVHEFGKTFRLPKLVLENYSGPYEVVITLVTPEGKPHPHRLVGQHCKEGICIFQGGEKDALSSFWRNRHNEYLIDVPNAYRSNEQYRQIERNLTWLLFKKMCSNVAGFFLNTVIDSPNIKIEPVNKCAVEEALLKRQRISDKLVQAQKTRHGGKSKVNPINDPFMLGFGHKQDAVDLSSVRLTFEVTLEQYNGNMLIKPFGSDVIFDSSPRILSLSQQESSVEGGQLVKMKVTRDDVRVEMFDKAVKAWAVNVHQGVQEDGSIEETKNGQTDAYMTELQFHVPEYPKNISEKLEVFIRLVTLDGKSQSAPSSFYYLPSETRKPEILKEPEEKKDFISRYMETSSSVKEIDPLAEAKKQYKEARATVKPAVRERRVTDDRPSFMGNETHRRKAGQKLVEKLFKSTA